MFLYQNTTKTVHVLVDGRQFSIPHSEPFEVKAIEGTDLEKPYMISSDKVGREIIRTAVLHGVVTIEQIRTARGFEFDMEKADKESTRLRGKSQLEILQRYVDGAKQDQLANLPIKPPSAPIQAILDERGLDLKRDYGITPVGYKVSEAVAARDAELAATKQENASLRADIDELRGMVNTLVRQGQHQVPEEVGAGGGKRK